MPKATVLTVTNRIGGLDIMFNSLCRQREKDFEWIVVDALYQYRAEVVSDHIRHSPFQVKHIEPTPNGFPLSEQSLAFNHGVAAASSPLIIYECDYTWFHPDTVQAHVDFQERHPGCCWMGDFFYAELPSPPVCPSYAVLTDPTHDEVGWMEANTAEANRMAQDLRDGTLDPYFWSIFEYPPEPPFNVNYIHTKKEAEKYDGDWNYFSFKNESVPIEWLFTINGHDEEYDGAHCKNDSEVAYRLREAGAQLWSGPRGRGAVTCLNPRNVLNCRALNRPRTANDELIWRSKRAEARIPVNTGFDLRERHARLHNS